jgi:hypothetical protein
MTLRSARFTVLGFQLPSMSTEESGAAKDHLIMDKFHFMLSSVPTWLSSVSLAVNGIGISEKCHLDFR